MSGDFYLMISAGKSTKKLIKYFKFGLAKVKSLRIFAPRIFTGKTNFPTSKSIKQFGNEKNVSTIQKEEKKQAWF